MNELFLRISTGLVFLVVVVGCIVWNPYSLASVFYVAGVIGMLEYYNLVKIGGLHPQITLGVLAGTVLYFTIELVKLELAPTAIVALSIPFFMAIFIYELYRERPEPFNNIAHTLMGIVYVMAPFALLNVFSFDEIVNDFQPELVLGFFVMLWLNDTGAYVFGKLLGRHKLFPKISPNKTWQGAFGGILAAIAGASILSTFSADVAIYHWFILAVIISVSAIFGDLVESRLKRSIGVKDSSNLLPGHGGILDRSI